MPTRITTYAQAFGLLGRPYGDKAKEVIKKLESEGRREKNICFAIWKSHQKIKSFDGDSRYWNIFINEVKKWAWGQGDQRWDGYWQKKNEEAKADALRKQAEEKWIKEVTYRTRYPGFIYFVQGETGGPIKIGYAKDVKKRINTLQTGYPDTLILLLAIPGNLNDEQKIHEELAEFRLRGEWFKPDQSILDRIKNKSLNTS